MSFVSYESIDMRGFRVCLLIVRYNKEIQEEHVLSFRESVLSMFIDFWEVVRDVSKI